jgi:propanol-preferring alcohol dehydrogenase
MRAFRVYGPEKADIKDVPRPIPGPDDVLIRVGGAGLCHTDVELAATAAFLGARLPLTGGHEIAGWVEDVGSSVTGLEPGEAVAVYEMVGCGRCRACLGGEDNLCTRQMEVFGVTRDGGLADYVNIPFRNVHPIGDLDVQQAAVLTDAGLTAYGSVRHGVDLLGPGSTAMVIGVGGLGHLAIQFVAALSPSRIIAIDVDKQRLDLARRVGAHHAFLAGEAAEQVREVVGADGVDVVYDFVANDSSMKLGCEVVRVGGAIALTGLGHGTFTLTTGFDSPVRPEVRIVRTLGGSRRDFSDILALAHDGRVTATVNTFELEQTADAIARLAAGTIIGRAVVVP